MSDPREPVDGVATPPADDDPNLGEIDDLDIDTGEEPGDDLEIDTDEQSQPQEVQPRPTRRERQTENWRTRAQEAEARSAEYERRLAALETRQTAPPPDPAAEQRRMEAEYERLAMLPPQDMVRELHGLVRREFSQGLNNVALQSAERADLAEYARFMEQHPGLKRYTPQIEQTVRDLRAQGVTGINRIAIAKFHWADANLERAAVQNGRQRRQGAANVARQTVRPASGRGDLARAAGNGRGTDADEALLRSVTVGEI